MDESTVLFLCLVQIALVCCCVYFIKSYCGFPFRFVSKLFRSLLRDPRENENAAEDRDSRVISASASPSHYQQIPAIYSPLVMPHFQGYPVHTTNFMSQYYPLPGFYPPHMGFHLAPPSLPTIPSASSLETSIPDESHMNLQTPTKQK